MIDRAIQTAKRLSYTQIPLILFTHSKKFCGFSNFEKLIQRLSEKDEIQFQTTRSVVSSLQEQSVEKW